MSLLKHRAGVSSVEFALVGPVFCMCLIGPFGSGMIGLYQLWLDDCVRMAARQIQIDGPAASSPTSFVNAVCSNFGMLASDCSSSLTYSVQASPLVNGFASITPATLPASGKFTNAFFNGTAYGDNVNILVQVAYPIPFKLPYVGTIITMTNTVSILSSAIVRAEPAT